MKCKYCQTDGHSYIYSGKGACEKCYENIFELKYNVNYTMDNGEVSVVWLAEIDDKSDSFKIYFRYDKSKTVFTRQTKHGEEVVLELNQVMPLTNVFLRKARNNIRVWQVFS